MHKLLALHPSLNPMLRGWLPQAVSRKVRIMDVVYNASNNELVRTQTLVKNAIVQIDAAPFKAWYQTHYGVELGLKGKVDEAKVEDKQVRKTRNVWQLRLGCIGVLLVPAYLMLPAAVFRVHARRYNA